MKRKKKPVVRMTVNKALLAKEWKPMLYWLQRIQALISKHSTKPRKTGKYKGHSSTNSLLWIRDLAVEVQADIRRVNKGIGYDENMALASYMGRVLFTWYACVHRAKSYDPERPVELRQKAAAQRQLAVANLLYDIADDGLMTKAFPGQYWNLPFGKGTINGGFV